MTENEESVESVQENNGSNKRHIGLKKYVGFTRLRSRDSTTKI